MNKKKSKKGLIIARVPRGCDVARKATWVRRGTQGHVAEPRGPAQRLRGALYIIIYIHTLYNKGYSAFRSPEGYSPL